MRDLGNRLKSLRRPIRVAVIGAGTAGKGLFYQAGITPGIAAVGLCDLRLAKAVAAAEEFHRPYRVVTRPGEVEDTIAAGEVALCEDAELLCRAQSVDVLLEACNDIYGGALHALAALETGKDVVMMNAEADLAFGPYLLRVAREHERVYTSCDGDQPGCLARLIDEVRLWGFELVMAGNIKGFLDRYADPTTILPEAEKRSLDPKMCAGFTDGTKLCVEMALVANGYDLVTLTPGMNGPRCSRVQEALELFDLPAIRDSGHAVVEYVLGARPFGGVFVIGYCDDPYQVRSFSWMPAEVGKGPFFVFDRPYHLVHIEAMRCVAEAFLDREPLLQPRAGLKTDVYAYAKRPLRRGEKLDGVGGYCCYGLIENRERSGAFTGRRAGLPICLSEGVTMARDVAQDDKIYLDDVLYDPDRPDFAMYRLAAEADESQRAIGDSRA
jgi:predicted homoserine dehydrogenase-like protein